jgi:hypothetical protein
VWLCLSGCCADSGLGCLLGQTLGLGCCLSGMDALLRMGLVCYGLGPLYECWYTLLCGCVLHFEPGFQL